MLTMRKLLAERPYKLNSQEATKAGVTLAVLPEERDWEGIPEYVGAYLAAKNYDRGVIWVYSERFSEYKTAVYGA